MLPPSLNQSIKDPMNTTTFYSLSASIMGASFFNIVGSELSIEAESRWNALFTEYIGNNNVVTNAIIQKIHVVRRKIGASYFGRCLSATVVTFVINRTLLGSEINSICYVAGFSFLTRLPKFLTGLAPYIGQSFINQEQFLGKVLHAATLTASIVIFPMLVLNSTTLVSFTFVALTGYTLYMDVYKNVF